MEIPLTRGFVAIVDAEDYERLSKINWYATKEGYARADIGGKRTGLRRFMHRLVLNIEDADICVDHINGLPYDNRKANLRIASHKQNLMNQKIRSDNSSGYKGVSRYRHYDVWRSYICINGQQKHLGYFKSKQDAAIAYNNAAKNAFGRFAKINEVHGG